MCNAHGANTISITGYLGTYLQNKQFVLKFKFRRNASKFPILFIQKDYPSILFVFHLEQLSFLPYE